MQLLALSALSAVCIFAFNYFASAAHRCPLLWLVLLVFFVVTGSTHIILSRASENSPTKFVGIFMATTMGKLVFLLVCISVLFISYRSQAVVVTIGFMLHYVTFTTFEITALLKHFKKPK